MGKIYTEQTDLTIKLDTGKDLTGISNVKIIAKTPTGVNKEFTATITNVLLGQIEYSILSDTDIDTVGNWTFWAKIVDASGLISIGEPSKVQIYKQGT